MRIAVCDDQQFYVDLIKREIIKEMPDMVKETDVLGFNSGKDLISEHLKYPFDAVFLDINMPDMDGREVAKYLRKISENLMLAFFSAEDGYVFDSFETSPIGYMRKMHLAEDVRRTCGLIKKKYTEDSEIIVVGEGKDIYEFCPAKVWFFESKRRYMLAYYGNGRYEKVKYSMKEMERILENKGFIRIYKSFLANYRYMYCLERKEVLLLDMETRLPLTKNRIKEIRDIYFDYLRGIR